MRFFRAARYGLVACILAFLMMCHAPLVAAQQIDAAARPIRDKWALVIGIGDFADKSVPRLKYATKDARDFYDYLIKDAHFAPDHVRLLLDDKASERRIMSELGSKFLARVVKPDDLVVIFFSTHGSPSQMDIRGKNYLCAYDTEPNDLFATGIEMQKILDSIQGRVLTDRVLLVLDACHSGSTDPNAKGIIRSGNFDAEQLAEGSGQLVICSSKPEEQSFESKRYDNGVFTRSLLNGLRSNSSKATLGAAFQAAKSAIADEVREDHPGARQTATMHSKWVGNDLNLAVKADKPQALPVSVASELEPDSSSAKVAMAIESKAAEVPAGQAKKLILNVDYFSQEANPKTAYTEACAQQAAHFNEPAYYFRKAKILIQLGNYSKAEQELKGLLVDEPNNWSYHLARGFCYYKLGKKIAAQNQLNLAKFHNPSLPVEIGFAD